MNYISGLLGFAVGDAFAAPVEGTKREELLAKPVTKMMDDENQFFEVGTWTDNTSLTIATIDSINAKCSIDYSDIMNKFSIYKQHSEYTPSKETINLDITVAKSIDKYIINKGNPIENGDEKSTSNGSLKRILPIAYYALEKHLKDTEILELTNNISSLTNKNEECKMACYIFVRYVMFLLNGKDKLAAYNMTRAVDYTSYSENTISNFSRILKNDISKYKLVEIDSSSNVVETLETVLWVFLNTDNYKDAIVGSTNLGGSTSTISSLTGSLAGITYGLDSIPEEWSSKLLRKDYLIDFFEEFSENKYNK